MNLYAIATEYQSILDQTFDHETGEINENELMRLDEVKEDLNQKGIAIASYIENIGAEEKAIEDAIKRMQARRKQLANKSNYLMTYLQSNMERCGITEISCPYFKVKFKKCPTSVKIDDEDKFLHDQEDGSLYVKTKQEKSIDKNKIKEDILAGKEVKGAMLINNIKLEIK